MPASSQKQKNTSSLTPPPLAWRDVAQHLQLEQPVWLLNGRGDVIAMNLLCAWLWDVSNFTDLLGVNVYEVFRRAFASDHLPKDANDELLIKKYGILMHLRERYGDAPYRSFLDYLASDPIFQKVIDARLTARRTWKSRSSFDYTLQVRPPTPSLSVDPLDFSVVVYRVGLSSGQTEESSGWLATYTPANMAATSALQEQVSKKRVVSSIMGVNYIQYVDAFTKVWVEKPYAVVLMERASRSINQVHQTTQETPTHSSLSEVSPGWEPSPLHAQVLSTPDVTLYVGPTQASRDAFETLDTAGITCRAVFSENCDVPAVEWAGQSFQGQEDVAFVATLLTAMDAELEAGMRQTSNPINPELAAWMQETRRGLSQEARGIVYELHRPGTDAPKQ